MISQTMALSIQWEHAKSHSKNFGEEEKAFVFTFKMFTSIQKTTAIPTAKLREQGHKSGFEVISFTSLCVELY